MQSRTRQSSAAVTVEIVFGLVENNVHRHWISSLVNCASYSDLMADSLAFECSDDISGIFSSFSNPHPPVFLPQSPSFLFLLRTILIPSIHSFHPIPIHPSIHPCIHPSIHPSMWIHGLVDERLGG